MAMVVVVGGGGGGWHAGTNGLVKAGSHPKIQKCSYNYIISFRINF